MTDRSNAKRSYPIDYAPTHHAFDHKDSRGRVIGAVIVTCEYECSLAEDAKGGRYGDEPGHYWAFQPHATRNGDLYGASQNFRLFKSEAERDAAVAKYLAQAIKAAAKKAA